MIRYRNQAAIKEFQRADLLTTPRVVPNLQMFTLATLFASSSATQGKGSVGAGSV